MLSRQGHGEPLLDFLDPALDLVGEDVSQAEHQEGAQRGRDQVGEEELQRRQLEDARRQVGRRAESDREPAQDQDLEPVPMKIALDLSFAGPGQESPGDGQAEHLLAVEVAQEVDDEVADQDADQAGRERERRRSSCRFATAPPPG